MPNKLPLSAVLITKNAASQLSLCLRSVTFCDEILVVDSGSSDGTVELAKQMGAQVIEAEWRGFGPMKQFAVEQAKNDWVLCIDADERISDDLQGAIAAELAVSPVPKRGFPLVTPTFRAWRFARCNRFMGRYLKHGEGYPDWSLRLFDRRAAHWSADPVHEKVLTNTEIGSLRGDLLHDSAETLESYLTKQNRYTTLAAEAAIAAGRRATLLQLLLSPLLRFVKFYVLRAGFLDGVPGLVHILIGCQNSFAKYAKMLALQRNGQ